MRGLRRRNVRSHDDARARAHLTRRALTTRVRTHTNHTDTPIGPTRRAASTAPRGRSQTRTRPRRASRVLREVTLDDEWEAARATRASPGRTRTIRRDRLRARRARRGATRPSRTPRVARTAASGITRKSSWGAASVCLALPVHTTTRTRPLVVATAKPARTPPRTHPRRATYAPRDHDPHTSPRVRRASRARRVHTPRPAVSSPSASRARPDGSLMTTRPYVRTARPVRPRPSTVRDVKT